jgi:hypothetical protein
MVERRRLGGGAPFPPGEYVVTCIGAWHDTSAAGNKMVVWTLSLLDGICFGTGRCGGGSRRG